MHTRTIAIAFFAALWAAPVSAYDNDMLHVHFDEPAGWQAVESTNSAAMFRPSDPGVAEGDAAYLVLGSGDESWVDNTEPAKSLSAAAERERRMAQRGNGSYRSTEDGDVQLGGSVPAKQFTFTASFKERPVKGRSFYYMDDGKLMLLTFHCAADKFDAHWAGVKTALESFKKTNVAPA